MRTAAAIGCVSTVLASVVCGACGEPLAAAIYAVATAIYVACGYVAEG